MNRHLRLWTALRARHLAAVVLLGSAMVLRANGEVTGPKFRFDKDTFSFANETVYVYPNGYAEERKLKPGEKPPAYVLHCFPMSRSTEQFRNFARFDPAAPPPDDAQLAKLVRRVTRHGAWRASLPPKERVVIPGYPDLLSLSKARALILQKNIGVGWTAYVRPGNWRMLPYKLNGPTQQRHTHERIDTWLARNDLFIAYLTSSPSAAINHAVVVYDRRPESPADKRAGVIHYVVYDPNHPEAPRDLVWDVRKNEFRYQKDWDFVGGKLTVLQTYSYWGQ